MPKLASIDAQSYAALTSQSLRATTLVRYKTFDPFSTTSSESQESYLTAEMLPYKHSSFLQAGVVKHNFFKPLVFYFFSLNVLNTLQNTLHSKHYPLVYLIFLTSTGITAFYRLHFKKLIGCRRSWRHSLLV